MTRRIRTEQRRWTDGCRWIDAHAQSELNYFIIIHSNGTPVSIQKHGKSMERELTNVFSVCVLLLAVVAVVPSPLPPPAPPFFRPAQPLLKELHVWRAGDAGKKIKGGICYLPQPWMKRNVSYQVSTNHLLLVAPQ